MTQRNDRRRTTAVYNAHVKTFGVALGITGIDWRLLRVLPLYRSQAARQARQETAKAVRAIRQTHGTFPIPPSGGIASAMPTYS
jgi:hypothetical protein